MIDPFGSPSERADPLAHPGQSSPSGRWAVLADRFVAMHETNWLYSLCGDNR